MKNRVLILVALAIFCVFVNIVETFRIKGGDNIVKESGNLKIVELRLPSYALTQSNKKTIKDQKNESALNIEGFKIQYENCVICIVDYFEYEQLFSN